jgi:regulator of replication initiation timing
MHRPSNGSESASSSVVEEDNRINRLHQEINFLKQKLDEKTYENETLRNTMQGESG